MNNIALQSGEADLTQITPRQLFLRDSVFFLVLTLITAALAGITLFLFHSFEAHREELSVRWATRGQTAMQQGQPDQAVKALRTALTYAPDTRPYQLLLAQALADSGRTDEATDYFLTLRETQPGDGFINLELARLARKRNNPHEAINYYRASIFGDWRGEGAARRRAVRLELADFLIERKEFEAARAELLIAAGNAPENPNLNLTIGDKLLATGDTAGALTAYKTAIVDDPRSPAALQKAGELAYSLGDYSSANRYLLRALNEEKPGANTSDTQQMSLMAHNAQRLLELSLSRELPPGDRAAHLAAASNIALARLNACAKQQQSQSLQDMKARWKSITTPSTQRILREDNVMQDALAQLIFDTETQTAQVCGPPTGDDARLLTLAQSHAVSTHRNGASN